MKDYKVCVYAITKNEEKFVNRWYESIKDADKIIVLDTGSTDNTVKLLKELNVDVYEKVFNPWRFDDARNESLNLVPDDYDICVCCDLDEVFESGWKEKLLNVWDDSVTRVKYMYNWSFDEYGKPGTSFLLNKIHKNKYYKWTHPVHEVLTPLKEEKEVLCKDIVVNHYPDKNKSRSSYLPLLELSVKEDPEDDRNMHYLGREYMYQKRYDDAINTLKKHLDLKSANWKDERCASLRFIARCYKGKEDIDNTIKYYEMAINEAPYLRESYVELAYIYYEQEKYDEAIELLKKAFSIKNKSDSYINEEFCWSSFIYDLYSLCLFNVGYYDEAVGNAYVAYLKNPNDKRLEKNLNFMKKYL